MKKMRNRLVLIFATMLVASTSAMGGTTNPCSSCWRDYQACARAPGADRVYCYERYEDCLAANGCVIP